MIHLYLLLAAGATLIVSMALQVAIRPKVPPAPSGQQ